MLNNYSLFGVNLYFLAFIFIIFSFLGWLMESTLNTVRHKKFINRGFLNIWVCPIYGTGMSLIILAFNNYRHNPFILFFGGLIFATALEYAVGYALEKLFHAKWWDYSKKKYNLHGRIAPDISLFWGIMTVIMMMYVIPFIERQINKIDPLVGNIFIYSFFIVMAVDFSVTVRSLLSLNKILEEVSTVGSELRIILGDTAKYLANEGIKEANNISEKLSAALNNDIDISGIARKWKEGLSSITEEISSKPKFVELSNNISSLKESYNKALKENTAIQRRIIKAFPDFRPTNYEDAFKELKELIEEDKETKDE